MKLSFFKSLLLLVMIAAFCAGSAQAQTGYYWNGPVPGPASGSFVNGTGPNYYTKLDTVNNTGTDTFKAKINGTNLALNPVYAYLFQSITYQVDVYKISGTPSSAVLTLYASNETGTGTLFAPVQSYTLTTNTQQCYRYSFPGNPATNYWWVLTGSGTMSVSWLCSLLVR